jgi:hypothetical protein
MCWTATVAWWVELVARPWLYRWPAMRAEAVRVAAPQCVTDMGVDGGSYAGGNGEEGLLDGGGGVVGSAGGEVVVVSLVGDACGSRAGGGAAALGAGRHACNAVGLGGYMGWG